MTMTMARTIKTGSITAAASSSAASDAGGSSVTLALALGSQAALAVISGTFTATLVFEGQAAGGSWVSVPAVPVTGGAIVTGASAAGNFLILAVGMIQVRVRCSAWTSAPTVELSNAPAGGLVFQNPGTGTAAAQVQGTAADAAAASGNPVQVGGVDGGGLAQALLVDTSGRAIVVGAAAAGAVPAGNPLAIGASDGTNIQYAAPATPIPAGIYGTSGNRVDTFQGNADAQLASNRGLVVAPLLQGYNGTTWDRLRTASATGVAGGTTGCLGTAPMIWNGSGYQPAVGDTSGRPQIVGAAATGAAVAGNPVNIGASDGTNIVQLLAGAANTDAVGNTNAALHVRSMNYVLNGSSSFERTRAVSGDAMAITGMLAAGTMLWDGSQYVRARSAVSDTLSTTGIVAAGNLRWDGSQYVRQRSANIFKVVALTAATAETTIWTPAGGKKFRLMGFLLTPGAASTLTFKDNTAGTTIFAARGTTDQPILFHPPSSNGILSAAANNVLTVTRGTSATLDGVVFGTEE